MVKYVNSLRIVAIDVNNQIIAAFAESQVIFGNTFTENYCIVSAVFINCIKTISEVINICIIPSSAIERIISCSAD